MNEWGNKGSSERKKRVLEINNTAMEESAGQNGDHLAKNAMAKKSSKNIDGSEPAEESKSMANKTDFKESHVDGGSAPAGEGESMANESNLEEGHVDVTNKAVISEKTEAVIVGSEKDAYSHSSLAGADLTALASLNHLGAAQKADESDGGAKRSPSGKTMLLILRQK